MKGKKHRIGKLLMLSLVSAGLLVPVQAKAAGYECEAKIPVEVREEGSEIPEGNEYTVKIRGVDGAPMPENGSVVIAGEGKAELGPISYTEPEDYQYEIWQEGQEKEHFTYDDTVYTVTVRVTNTEDGTGLEAQIWAIKEGEEAKSEIVFENRYEKPSKPWNPGSEDEDEEDDAEVPAAVTPPAQTPGAPIQIPEQPAGSQAHGAQTGDSANVALWTSTAGLGALALVAVIARRRRREQEG